MRKLSPIPEDVELNDETAASPASDDLRVLMDELKDTIAAPRDGEQDFAAAIRELTRAVDVSSARNGEEGVGSRLRLGVFVDTANLIDRDPDGPIQVDFAKLLAHVIRDRRLVHARAYCPIYADFVGRLEHQHSVAPVWGHGYDIVTKPIKVFADGTRKADLDIVLVMDVIRRLRTMDVVALMSGDGDYVPMVEYLREHGLRVEVYSFAEAIAEELRRAADDWSDITAMPELQIKAPRRAAPRRRTTAARKASAAASS